MTIVFLADGFEECEGLITVDILRRAGVETVMASVMGRPEVLSSRHIRVMADVLAEDVSFDDVDLIVLPGGRLGTENLAKSDIVKEQCRRFAAAGSRTSGSSTEEEQRCPAAEKRVAAICAAPSLLAGLGLLEGRPATCHPDFEPEMKGALLTGESVVTAGNIITGQGLGATFEFAFELVRLLVGEEKVEQIKKAICYKF